MNRVESVNVGLATALIAQGRRVMSAIVKRPVDGPVAVHPLGLEGDEQADLEVHGGVGKAVYAYPVEHYAFWQTVRSQAGVADWSTPLVPGALGENLTLSGLLETQAFVGDLLKFPDCTLAVSEPRYPCFKFNAVMGFPHAVKLMTQSVWCGFYLAVRTPGTIRAGESYEVIPGPREIGIDEIFRARTTPKRS